MEDSLEGLKEVLTGSKLTLLLCHDFPDPDCLASAYGIQFLLKLWKIESVIAYGGFIGRAENRALVQKLELTALPLGGLDLADYDRVVLIDTQPASGNHSLPAEIKVDAAIDHHPVRPGTEALPFSDIREDMGASSTIVTQYLRKAKVEINYKLATALYYGLKADTQDLSRENSTVDKEVYHYLFSRVDHRLLSQIENPSLDKDFFETITRAFRKLESKGAFGFCYLGKITRPDLVAEMADEFVRINEIEWMACFGYLKNLLYFSIRTRWLKAEAGEVAQELVKDEKGSAGGHGQIAAGRLEFNAESPQSEQLLDRVKGRYFEILSNVKKDQEEP